MEASFDLDSMDDEFPIHVIRQRALNEVQRLPDAKRVNPLAELAIGEVLDNVSQYVEHAKVIILRPEVNYVDIIASGIKKLNQKRAEDSLSLDEQLYLDHGRGEKIILAVCPDCYKRNETLTDNGVEENVWLRIKPESV